VTRKASQCVEIEAEIQAVAAGEAEPEAARRVDEHVRECVGCQAELERYQRIEREVATMRNPLAAEPLAALARERLEARLADLRTRLVAYEVITTAVGRILLAASEQGLVLVEYLDRRHDVPRILRDHELEPAEDGGQLDPFGRELQEYFDGRRTRLEWPLDFKLVRSPFQRKVLEETAAIPYGAVMSYAGVARELGRPEAVRAAAQALRWNPLAIVIPCHRVVGSTGALTGYAGSGRTDRKRRLLDLEGVPTARLTSDFRIRPEAMYVLTPGSREYCLPTCSSLEPAPAAHHTAPVLTLGARLFASRERAEAAGLLPCTTCRPDSHPLNP